MKMLANFGIIAVMNGLSSKEWRTKRVEKSEKKSAKVETFRIYQEDLSPKKNVDGVVILDWWGKKEAPPYLKRLTEDCGGCYLTNDQKREKSADGILLDNTRFLRYAHLDKLEEKYFNPPSLSDRNSDQYWIFWPREAASKGADGAELMTGGWDSAFNLTTSYRMDSDIPRPFGDYESELKYARYKYKNGNWTERQTPQEHLQDIMAQKTSSNYASWMVSNCDQTGGADQRFEYVTSLIKEGLKMDGYGHCFENVVGDRPWTIYQSNGVQWGQFAKYKFYLALENSVHCTDYMSEKFWRNSLRQGLVPIVSGSHKDDVQRMAPPNSFIHVEDFASPKDLVDYLEYLSRNDTAYEKYHQWRMEEPDFEKPFYMQPEETMICGICKEVTKRKNLGFPKRMIKSVANWWWVNQHDEQCIAGQDLPSSILEIPTVTMENSFDELRHLHMHTQTL